MKQKAPEKKTEKDMRPKNPERVFSQITQLLMKRKVLAPLKLQSSQQCLLVLSVKSHILWSIVQNSKD